MLALSTTTFAQKKPKLLAGPVVGSVTSTSAKVWIGYRGKGDNALILGDTAENKIFKPSGYSYITNSKGEVALTMEFTNLKPNHTYNILISIDGWGTHAKHSFTTQSDSAVKDFNFLLGSCNLMNTDFTRAVFPGATPFIFKRMKKKKGEFMVWLGDNLYYWSKHYSSYEGMFERNMRIRHGFPKLREFLATQPNYAIWDDHDYGPNDSDKSFTKKDSSLMVFKGFWPNTYSSNEKLDGNFYKFRYYDAEFFMLDDRWYRDSPGDTSGAFLGEKQVLWLKNNLTNSDATFKFICIGSQILNDNHFGESYADYTKERNELLDYIARNNIKGVIFLTGDKHYSELCKRDWNGYPMYDFTASPLTSPPLPRRLFGAYKNQWRVSKSDYGKRNFGRINITGPVGDRSITFEIYGRAGTLRRQVCFNQNDICVKPSK